MTIVPPARPVRVRIGPSPTGEPHVGTGYIALFNLAFARKNGGKFILRIEDTDRDRSRLEWEKEIISGLTWLGLSWDEGPDKGGPFGPYRQSERTPIYQTQAQILLDAGHAYRCFCTEERLAEVRALQKEKKSAKLGYDLHCRELSAATIAREMTQKTPCVIRMKMPIDGQTLVPDRLRGEVAIDNAAIDDQILLKSDGFPTYHLANVVDDHLMEISHVIRAEEWINSTPKHLVLYRMFGWQPPEYYHMPLLRNADKSKISKRKNPVSILDYKDRGFLPQAVLNYLAMLGWTMPDGREIFSLAEFIEHFDWSRLHLGGPIFDLDKLTWLNGKYYREKLSEPELTALIRSTLFSEEAIQRLVPLVKERIDLCEAFVPATEYFFSGAIPLDPQQLRPADKTFKELREVLEKLVEVFDQQVDFSAAALEELLRRFAESAGWGTKDLFMPLRLVVTGRSATPPLFETLAVLGRAKVRRRLRAAIEVCKEAAKKERPAPKVTAKKEGP